MEKNIRKNKCCNKKKKVYLQYDVPRHVIREILPPDLECMVQDVHAVSPEELLLNLNVAVLPELPVPGNQRLVPAKKNSQ